MAISVIKTLVLGALLIAAFYVLFNYVVPLLLNTSTMQRNRELPILLAIVVGFGSTVAAHEFGLSPALGAFVAGMLLAESPFATQIRADVGGLRTLLMTLFFSSIGMLGDPAWIVANVIPVVALVAAIVVGKALIVLVLMRAFGVNLTSAIAAGVCLAQVGEFSFVLAAVAKDGAITEYQFMLMVSATIVSLFLTTFLVTFARPIALRIERLIERIGLVDRMMDETPDAPAPLHDHIILVGYGPAGQAVAEWLIDSDYSVAVVDLNRKAIGNAQKLGFHAMIGDATHADVLEHLHVADASVVVITLPDPAATTAIIRLSKSLSPGARGPAVLARARYHIHQLEIAFAGADIVIDEERQVGQRLAAALRRYVRKTETKAAEEAETQF